ncbi:hypothetical protein E4U13_001128 [Claviceps humidiphila]|uniref:SWIM-type domain-containing protein n=1 Tax=Claviceps humidiphila TaxID=1294629 RepID=A0A9P7TVF8_9HYPO|nr:hypothetical protein E4U13_001128 [Claviceps humidiphila]
MRAYSLLAVLLPLVSANAHAQCDCQTWSEGGQWGYNRDLTHWICYHVLTNTASFMDNYGRCVATQSLIDGQGWEDLCVKYGTQEGYRAFDNKGNPIESGPLLKVGAATGHCPDRY